MIPTKLIFAARDREAALAEGAALLAQDELVVFPTETVYGLGANALRTQAVSKIFTAKGRPQDNPLIVHIAQMDQMEMVAREVPEFARKAAQEFWPGPLSIILPKSERIPENVSAGLCTVAVRMPAHPFARDLIARAGVPVAAPSANTSGKPSPTQARHAFEDLCGRVPLIIDDGACAVGVESTVLDCTGEVPIILRPGHITQQMLEKVLGQVKLHPSLLTNEAAQGKVASPGMKYRHYAPKAKLIVFTGEKKAIEKRIISMYDGYDIGQCAILCLDAYAPDYELRRIIALGEDGKGAQARLFAALREADEQGLELLLFHADPMQMGLAVMNRIAKASGNTLVDCDAQK